MKTKMNISKLKKGLVTICSALVITTGSFTQPNPSVNPNDEMTSIARLEAFMNGTEQSIRFVAPAVVEDEAIAARERLNILADGIEVTLKYEAPAAEVAPEMERLDNLADVTECSMKYQAPAAEQGEVAPELASLDIFAASVEKTLAFKAPAVEDAPESDNIQDNSTEIMLANKTK
jgi:hypothetical protein